MARPLDLHGVTHAPREFRLRFVFLYVLQAFSLKRTYWCLFAFFMHVIYFFVCDICLYPAFMYMFSPVHGGF